MRRASRSPASRADRRGEIIHLWRFRNQSLRLAQAFQQALQADPVETRRAIAIEIERIEAERAMEAVRLAQLRHSVSAASPLLVAACAAEDLDLAAVAWGVLPTARAPGAGDGHPWLPVGSSGWDESVRLAPHLRMKDRWEAHHCHDGGFVRGRCHPVGRWGVQLRDGVLQTNMATAHWTLTTTRSHAAIDIDAGLPATIVRGCDGIPVGRVVDHPLLADPSFEITSASADGAGRARIRFRCAPVPLGLARLRPGPGMEWQQLGRNGRLSGDVAVADLLARSRADLDGGLATACPAAIIERAIERARIAALMAPPWAERLELPTPAELAGRLRAAA